MPPAAAAAAVRAAAAAAVTRLQPLLLQPLKLQLLLQMTFTLQKMTMAKFTVALVKFTVRRTEFTVKFRVLAATAAVSKMRLAHLAMLLLALPQVIAAAWAALLVLFAWMEGPRCL
jgi:D-aminopeptidase